ncbi:MAG: hypothetical protein LBU51_01890 [Bacteroidales bacterium]|jgi:hypothetical protein|nr:hypothetical protein [Bacteroidales bacterium]
MRGSSLISVFFILFFITGSAYSQEKIDFKLNLIEGRCFIVTEETTNEGTISRQSKESESYSYNSSQTKYLVTKVSKTGFELQVEQMDFAQEMKNSFLNFKISKENADKKTFIALLLNWLFFSTILYCLHLIQRKGFKIKKNRESIKRY